MLHKFKKTYIFEGKEYAEIDLNLDGLTGGDLIKASQDAKLTLSEFGQPEMSKAYQAIIAAKACKQPIDFILNLPAFDFTSITCIVGNFLFGMDYQN